VQDLDRDLSHIPGRLGHLGASVTLSAIMRDRFQQARRRARRGRPLRDWVLNAMFWTGLGAWLLERVGWIPDQPIGLGALGAMAFLGRDAIRVPFWRRTRPLLLPGARSIPLAELTHMPAERHVHVRGRIRALEPLRTYLGEIDDAVYSRVELIGTTPKWLAHRDFRVYRVHTRDFLLVDETGATVEIRMDQAEVTLPRRTLHLHDPRVAEALLDQLQLPCPRPSRLHRPVITEHWLADGDEIEVLGTVEREADPRQEALPRELPTRPVLVSARGRPLTVQLLRAR